MIEQTERRAGRRLAGMAGSVRAGLARGEDGSGPCSSWLSPAGAMWIAGRSRAAGAALLGLLLELLVLGSGAAKTGAALVTCGSVLKLFNTQHRVRLHSHDIKYGSGALGLGLGHRQGAGRSWESAGLGSGRSSGWELLGD